MNDARWVEGLASTTSNGRKRVRRVTEKFSWTFYLANKVGGGELNGSRVGKIAVQD